MALEITDIPVSGVNGPKRTPKKEMGKDDFLMLLTKQLQNQDPMKPMDNTEFVAQMANFSSLEQMANMNKSLQAFISNTNESYKFQAMGMLGKKVTAQISGQTEVISGAVSAVRFKDGETIFKVGTQDVKSSEILTIENTGA